MRRTITGMSMMLAALCLAFNAYAWGPVTGNTIVSSAAHVVSKEENAPISKLMEHVKAGADAGSASVEEMMPGAGMEPITAIEAEMLLLRTIYSGKVDAYLAYRLGVLGSEVARVTSPMYNAAPGYRGLYDDDMEKNIKGVSLKTSLRRSVEPKQYFAEVMRERESRTIIIEKDYEDGVGWAGMASQAAAQDISISVDAVADVWMAILRGGGVSGVSAARKQEYGVGAVKYYTRLKQFTDADKAYARMAEDGDVPVQVMKKVADLYFEAEAFEQSMERYHQVLEKDPGQKDVIERIAAYHAQKGEAALEAGQLEQAVTEFDQAARVDKISGESQRKAVEAQSILAERNNRQTLDQTSLDEGLALEKKAEEASTAGDKTLALNLLMEAKATYGRVTEEFRREHDAALAGLDNIAKWISRLQREMLDDASRFSGAGASMGTKETLARMRTEEARTGLKSLVQKEYDAQVAALAKDLDEELSDGVK